MKKKIFIWLFAILLSSCSTTLVLDNSPKNHLDCVQPVNAGQATSLQGIVASFDEEDNQIELWDSNKGKTLTLGRVEILSGALSSQNQIAIIDANAQQVKIFSPEGKTLSTFSAFKNWIEIIDWIDNQQLLIGSMPFRSDGGWNPPSSTISLDINSGQYIEFPPSYPNIYTYASGPPDFGDYSFSLTAYDPGFTKVVYPAQTPDYFYLSLWDVPAGREVTRLETLSSFGEVKWKKSGDIFAVSMPPIVNNTSNKISDASGSELFLVSKDGEAQRLTYFTESNVAKELSLSWSPDDEKIAFWLKIESEPSQWQLVVVNTKTMKIANYCIDGEGSLPIIWSSDSNQLMSTFSSKDFAIHQFLLIDVQANKSKTWSSNSKVVVGWFDE